MEKCGDAEDGTAQRPENVKQLIPILYEKELATVMSTYINSYNDYIIITYYATVLR